MILALTLILISAQSAWSNDWKLDKGHSGLVFNVNHIFSKTFGQFKDFDAAIVFDPASLDKSSLVFKIKVDSIDTNIAKRDKHLLSPDFFDAGKFPEIAYTSSSISKVDDTHYKVVGTLIVKGKNYALDLPLEYLGPKDHPMQKGSQVAGFNVEVTLDRLAYGIGDGKFYKNGVVGKDVEVQLSLEVLSK